jgi:hypothetical protein
MRSACDGSAEKSAEGEQGARQRLSRTVAGQENGFTDPPGSDHGVLQERQNHMTTAKDERARSIESRKNPDF